MTSILNDQPRKKSSKPNFFAVDYIEKTTYRVNDVDQLQR